MWIFPERSQNQEFFLIGSQVGPQGRSDRERDGTMEKWNVGILEEWLGAKPLSSFVSLNPLFHHSNIPAGAILLGSFLPVNPSFQYSIIPRF
jgi:hypothetical protein